MRNLVHAALVAGMLLIAALGGTAQAAPEDQAGLPAGTTVGLSGTPHLWVAGQDGLLHWAGDTRALTGRVVDWSSRRDVTLDQLRSLPRGAPWLSAGLLKDGDPIYFVKWESSEPAPQLLHIQSIADVELFGIDGANYGQFVLDRAAWEQQFRLGAAALTRGVLASATTASVPSAVATTSGTTTTARAASAPGVLANALSATERTAFIESVLDSTSTQRATKWVRPITVRLVRSSYDAQSVLLNDMIDEVSGLIGGTGISRVPAGGDIEVNFVPLSEVQAKNPKALGYADYFVARSGAMSKCTITIAQEPEAAYGSLVQHFSPQMKTDLLGLVARHEFAHCLGLGHNQSKDSFLSYSFDGLNSFYSTGARAARYNDFDRALIRTLYHSAITPGLAERGLRALLGA
ncbi:MAG TPA: DUF2927 domain-containing protein [Chloroflexota bacterium]|nr:DUF2927 domain-containing protein [Chloroflexota bacterium]